MNFLYHFRATTDKAKVAILNDFTDECLKLLNEFLKLNSADPLPLEDLVTGFAFVSIKYVNVTLKV